MRIDAIDRLSEAGEPRAAHLARIQQRRLATEALPAPPPRPHRGGEDRNIRKRHGHAPFRGPNLPDDQRAQPDCEHREKRKDDSDHKPGVSVARHKTPISTSNVQRSTSNVQMQILNVGRWKLDVGPFMAPTAKRDTAPPSV